jgi:hypothetical protein
MGNAGDAKGGRGRQLVMAHDQRARLVEDEHAGPLSASQLPEPTLNAVQRRANVEPSEHGVSRLQRLSGALRRQPLGVEAEAPRGCE